MIEKLTSTTVTQKCQGLVTTKRPFVPCSNHNMIPWSQLYLGRTQSNPVILDAGSGNKVLFFPKVTGKQIEIIDPGVSTAALSISEMADVITITLAHDGMVVTSTLNDIVTKVKSAMTIKDEIGVLRLGVGTTVAKAMTKIGMYYAGDTYLLDQISLPSCPNCKSNESFMRTWDTPPLGSENSDYYRLRAAINFLGKKLKEAGQVHPLCEAAIMAETMDPPNILTAYPPGDGTI